MNCEVKLGLFVLKDCGEIQHSSCTNCNKALCVRHTHKSEKGELCPECLIELYPENSLTKNYKGFLKGENPEYNSNYYFNLRNDFQKISNFRPFSDPDFNQFNTSISQRDFKEEKSGGKLIDS